MNILGSLGGGAHLGLGNLTGMTLGNLNAVLIGGTATLPSKGMFLEAAFQDGYFPRQWAAGTHEQGELIYCKTNIAGFFFDAGRFEYLGSHVPGTDTDHHGNRNE